MVATIFWYLKMVDPTTSHLKMVVPTISRHDDTSLDNCNDYYHHSYHHHDHICSYHQYHHNLMILIILRDAIMAQNGSLFTQCVKGGISTKNNQIDQHEKWSPHKTIISSLPLLFLAAQRLSQDGSERLLNIEHLLLQDWSLPKHQTFGWRIFIARLNASLS